MLYHYYINYDDTLQNDTRRLFRYTREAFVVLDSCLAPVLRDGGGASVCAVRVKTIAKHQQLPG